MSQLSTFLLGIILLNVAKTYCSEKKIYSLKDYKDWWETATIYQIYPKSFKDSDGDGIGDLNGIIEKLDYIRDLGVTAIWLSPIFKSPQYDGGYDISDFRDIDPIFGNLETFKELVDEAHKRDLKVILDYVPNHSSHQHQWFQQALNGDERYENYYIWANGKNGSSVPPNNWLSVFTHSAWQWREERQQYYFHQYLKEQPDLNYRNEDLRNEMKDILTYWLDEYDVDGVRIDAVSSLVEAKNLTDEPRSNDPSASDIDYNYLNHIFTNNQPETYEVVYDWRSHIDSISAHKSSTKVCFTETYGTLDEVIRYYGAPDGSQRGAHFTFNFGFLKLTNESNVQNVSDIITGWLNKLPSVYTSNWVLGNHDNHRIASKVGKDRVDLLNLLTGFLPGVQITYNGEEIGMENGEVSCQQGKDLADNCTSYPSSSRDFERTPFQWDSSEFAGFTTGNSTWLPVSTKKVETNVEDQLKDPRSHLNIFRKLQELRQGDLKDQKEIEIDTENGVLVMVRYNNDKTEIQPIVYMLIINFGTQHIENFDFVVKYEILLTSGNSEKNWGDIIYGPTSIMPQEALLLKRT